MTNEKTLAPLDLKELLKEKLNSLDDEGLTEIMRTYDTDSLVDSLEGTGVEFSIEKRHGGEDQGEEYWTVYKFTRGDEFVYVQFDGWYQSYYGSEFSEWFFVEPKIVSVTVYNKV